MTLPDPHRADFATPSGDRLSAAVATAEEREVLEALIEFYEEAFAQSQTAPLVAHEDQAVIDYCCAELVKASQAVMADRFLDAKICALNASKAVSVCTDSRGNPVAKALVAKQLAPTQVCPFLAQNARAVHRNVVLGGSAEQAKQPVIQGGTQQLPGAELQSSVEARIKEALQQAKLFLK